MKKLVTRKLLFLAVLLMMTSCAVKKQSYEITSHSAVVTNIQIVPDEYDHNYAQYVVTCVFIDDDVTRRVFMPHCPGQIGDTITVMSYQMK